LQGTCELWWWLRNGLIRATNTREDAKTLTWLQSKLSVNHVCKSLDTY